MGGGDLRCGVNLKRRNARRRFKISSICIGGQFLAVISSAAISEAANDRQPAGTQTYDSIQGNSL